MRFEYIDPFVNSTIDVLHSFIPSDITRGALSLRSGYEMQYDIAVGINLSGDSEGSVFLNMTTETAVKLCNLMNGVELDDLTSLGLDSISELANMITGNATSVLNDMGFGLEVHPPLVAANGGEAARTFEVEIFQIPLFTECGEIKVNIALKTN